MTTQIIHEWAATATTVGAASATVSDTNAGDETPSGSCGYYVAKCVGRDTTAGVGVAFQVSGVIQNVAGTRTLSGTSALTAPQGSATLTAATGALIISGAVAGIQITGVVGKTIAWDIVVSIVMV